VERILIIGCGGAGKSTLARQLGEKLKLPVVHLDKLFWKSGWVESTKDEIDQKITQQMANPQWIIDGNYNRTLPMRLAACDCVIYLDYNRFTCLFGVLKRILTNYGKVRPDMGEGCPERFDWEFILWVWSFNRKHREKIYQLLSGTEGVAVHIFRNRRQLNRFLKSL